jgi:hypothetical protein
VRRSGEWVMIMTQNKTKIPSSNNKKEKRIRILKNIEAKPRFLFLFSVSNWIVSFFFKQGFNIFLFEHIAISSTVSFRVLHYILSPRPELNYT